MTDEKKKEYTLRISSANSTGLTQILYEMILDYLDEASKAVEAGDKRALKRAVSAARGCVKELMESLDFGYELAGNFMSLYVYVNRELLQAEIKRDKEHLENAGKVIGPLRDCYVELAKQDKSEPLMSNTQKVVAGLTYSKNEINESLESEDNRGFYV